MLNWRRRVAIRDHLAEANLFARRAIVAIVVVIILIASLINNLYYLQVDKYQDYQTRADGNRIKVQPVAPNRGLIYDRFGRILAENSPFYSLDIVPEEVDDLDHLLAQIGELIELTDDSIEDFKKNVNQQRRKFKPVTLKSKLSEQDTAVLSVHQHKLEGAYIEARLKRHYPYKDLTTHALGYVAKINQRDADNLELEGKSANYEGTYDIGKLGVEKYYESILHGEVGYQEVEVNNRGRPIRTLSQQPPVPGQDLILNLDIDMQQLAKDSLGDRRGAIVVLDAKDNGILALYSNPSYDPNLFVHGISSKNYKALLDNKSRPLINRTTQGRYPPASTIKPHIGLLGLEEDLITTKTRVWDPGYYQIKGIAHKYRDWKTWGHGWVDIYRAIEESCDVYYYDLAIRLGMDKISDFMTQFGFGELTGVDIYEETSATMPSREWKYGRFRQPWYAGDTISIGIGQGYWTSTPLQLATGVSVLANEGQHFEPKLLKATQSLTGTLPVPAQDRPPVQMKDPDNWQIIKTAMQNVVEKNTGTGHRAFEDVHYHAAGKTGTAQVIGIAQDEKYDAEKIAEKYRDNALFVGFAPVADPDIVVAVVIENVGGGSKYAAPVARRMMDYYFENYQETQP
ncbi:penicillin-binding protein 2 [Catenovulum adriaticum]|uniref:Peptidoglycan D,D-transpeptidase MrdA n=1 Tax=Catenovulum adriaticum TaxID=2984846 RepID=A0ABY7AMY4_9ALTE|nr:penicillin-binding protein 2 [Catenovulum sp. TS8]WAJ70622.1 penicillin-binding protein 2 [Catenovulum sp. TS8]